MDREVAFNYPNLSVNNLPFARASSEYSRRFNALKQNNMLVLIDGKYRKLITVNENSVKVTKSKNVTSFIRFETDFYDRLKNRLLFQGNGMTSQKGKPSKRVIVLDTSAFVAGLIVSPLLEQVTVPQVEEEISKLNDKDSFRFGNRKWKT